MRLALVALGLVFTCFFAVAHASESNSVDSHQLDAHQLDEVVVTGVRAGIPLWQVRHGEHVLWILGVLDPLPEKLQWQSPQVNQVLATAQQVLLDTPAIALDASLFGKVRLYLQWRRMQKNAHGNTLRELLPADVYEQFTRLRQQYAPRKNFESLRPILAGAQLYREAVASQGLTERRMVAKTVEKLAKQHHLQPKSVQIKIDAPGALLQSLNQLTLPAEIGCLQATLTYLETDLMQLRERVNAWALGDVQALRRWINSEDRGACWQVLMNVPRVESLVQQMDQQWLELAEQSLRQHASTLALRPVRDLLSVNASMLEWFRRRGYEVIEP